jgi:transcriptional regulator with XRE-family HTH domain
VAIAESLAVVVQELRLEQGLTQEALADAASLHRTYIGLVERGQRGPTVAAAAALARALGISLTELISRAEKRLDGLSDA